MTSLQFDTIFTLDARTNILLEVMTDHLGLNSKQVFQSIQESFAQLKAVLHQKGIDYAKLKGALVPSTTREEWGFFFDWELSSHSAYGREAMHTLLPLLNPKSTHSVLCGDWVLKDRFSKWALASPRPELSPILDRPAGDGATLFFIYLNNLSSNSAKHIAEQLNSCASYLGAANFSSASVLKAGLARQLVRAFVKHRRYVIQAHEDDLPAEENSNLSLYDFEKYGLKNRSIPSWLYGQFLSYKIESPPISGERDTEFALNALSDSPVPLSECNIELAESKFAHLLDKKGGSIKRAGLAGLSSAKVVGRIMSRLESNYVYNMSRSDDGRVLKFNVVLELTRSVRSLVALEYIPDQRRIRVITFY